jgi:hypothetical protein
VTDINSGFYFFHFISPPIWPYYLTAQSLTMSKRA